MKTQGSFGRLGKTHANVLRHVIGPGPDPATPDVTEANPPKNEGSENEYPPFITFPLVTDLFLPNANFKFHSLRRRGDIRA